MNILGIDPGKGGGVCFKHSKGAWIFHMPEKETDLFKFIEDMKRDYGNFMVFIEKVNMWVSDTDQENRGKAFRVAKLLANYNSLLTIIKLAGVPIVEVHPRTWQKDMIELYGVNPKEFKNPKNAYKIFAIERYNNPKINLKTADACCIAFWGGVQVKTRPSWVKENISNKETLNLFS